MKFTSFMPQALAEARAARDRGETPVGAVVVSADGKIIGRGGNETRALCDPTAHAEVLAIRRACETLGSERLPGASLWVTLEPCPLCASAISLARIGRVYYGATDPKTGGVAHGPKIFSAPGLHHYPEVYSGYESETCGALLTSFFKEMRR